VVIIAQCWRWGTPALGETPGFDLTVQPGTSRTTKRKMRRFKRGPPAPIIYITLEGIRRVFGSGTSGVPHVHSDSGHQSYHGKPLFLGLKEDEHDVKEWKTEHQHPLFLVRGLDGPCHQKNVRANTTAKLVADIPRE